MALCSAAHKQFLYRATFSIVDWKFLSARSDAPDCEREGARGSERSERKNEHVRHEGEGCVREKLYKYLFHSVPSVVM